MMEFLKPGKQGTEESKVLIGLCKSLQKQNGGLVFGFKECY